MVGQVHICQLPLSIHVFYSPEFFRVVPGRIETFETNNLVAPKTSRFIYLSGVDALKGHVLLGPDDKISASIIDFFEALPVLIAPVHDIKSVRFKINKI